MEVAQESERQVLEGLARREFPFIETMVDGRWLTLDSDEGPLKATIFGLMSASETEAICG